MVRYMAYYFLNFENNLFYSINHYAQYHNPQSSYHSTWIKLICRWGPLRSYHSEFSVDIPDINLIICFFIFIHIENRCKCFPLNERNVCSFIPKFSRYFAMYNRYSIRYFISYVYRQSPAIIILSIPVLAKKLKSLYPASCFPLDGRRCVSVILNVWQLSMVFKTSSSSNLEPNCFDINPFKFQWPICKRCFNVNEPQAIFDTDKFMLFTMMTCIRKEEESCKQKTAYSDISKCHNNLQQFI